MNAAEGGGGGTTAYAYYRLNITAKTATRDYVEVDELELRTSVAGASAAVGAGGTATASSILAAGFEAALAFDGAHSIDNRWVSQSPASFPEYVQYQFTSAEAVVAYLVQTTNTTVGAPTAWTLEGSDDGITWTTLDTVASSGLTDLGGEGYLGILDGSGERVGINTWLPGSPNTTFTDNAHVGWRFTVGSDPITVTDLRIFGSATTDETVRLFRHSDGAELASVTITPVVDEWVSGAITPVELSANTAYVVSTIRADGTSRAMTRHDGGEAADAMLIDPAIAFTSDAHFGSGTSMPTGAAGALLGIADIVFTLT